MIEIVGLGYIGLPTALMLAANKNKVTGVDKNDKIIMDLLSGKINTTEEGMVELYQAAKENGIRFSQVHIVADIYVIAVPTPYIKKDKRLDAKYVLDAFREVCKVAPKGATVVIEIGRAHV